MARYARRKKPPWRRNPRRTDVQAADVISQPSACLIDGMVLVQRLKGCQKTFAEIAESLLSMALNEGTSSDRIDVVFDDYRDKSI